MACIDFALTIHPQTILTVVPLGASVSHISEGMVSALEVTPQPQATLTIGEVCTASGGDIYVLASSDGPLRTYDGGYLLLDPSQETD